MNRVSFVICTAVFVLGAFPAMAAVSSGVQQTVWPLAAGLSVMGILGIAGGYLLGRRKRTVPPVSRTAPPAVLTGTDPEADYDRMFDVVAQRLEERRRELRESEHLLRLMMDSLPIGVFYLDRDLRYRLTNRTVEQWFGLQRDEMVGSPLREVVGDDAFRRMSPQIARAAGGAPVLYEMMMPYSQGGERYIVSNIVPHVGDDDEIHGYFFALNDLTARKKAEDAVLVARDAAEKAGAAKTRFLAAASHDLRQPLHAMRLLTGVLAARLKGGPERGVIDDLTVSQQSMEGMLNALLDISQLESGLIHPDIADFPVEEILYRVEREFLPQAHEHGLELHVVPSTAIARSDLALLERIVANFVANAIRYTERGRILVGCRRREGRLRIEVWDSGIGIAEDQVGAIFEEYYQVANPARDRSKGLGLGLALVDRLARTLDHKVVCRSVPGKGSVFSVEFAQGATDQVPLAATVAAVAEDVLKGRRILVVEDDVIGLNAMRLWLSGLSAQVVAAASGAQVAEALERGNFDCDLIIADHRLPNQESGAKVIRRVRHALGRPVPAIILTGDTAPEIRAEAEASGYGFARKPIDPETLRREIAALLEHRTSDMTTQA